MPISPIYSKVIITVSLALLFVGTANAQKVASGTTATDSSLFIDARGDTYIKGDTHVKGNTRITGDLNVTKNTQMLGKLKVKGLTDMDSLSLNGKPIFFREPTGGFLNANESIAWNKAEDRIDFTSNCGYNFMEKLNSASPQSPILRLGRRKLVGNRYEDDMIAFDLSATNRTATGHPTKKLAMYVTGDITDRLRAIQFRESNGSQGIGFTMNAIFTAGTLNSQDLNLEVVGSGKLILKTQDAARMVINNKGFVGIGTTDPLVPLHVKKEEGSSTYDYSWGIDDKRNSLDVGWGHEWVEKTIDQNRGFKRCSILADGDIVTRNVLVSTSSGVFSDIRLKKNITFSSSKQDLDKLNQIQVVNYKMIDTIADDKQYKKVIAQQIKSVYPQATGYSFRTLPDVFQLATSITKKTDSVYLVSVDKTENLKAGDEIELKCQPAQDVNVKVDRIVSSNTFLVRSKIALNQQTSVFVYGHPATDVLTVDYDSLSMLNISATQELSKTINELQKQVQQLKKQNADMALENEKLKADQAKTNSAILTRLVLLEEAKK